MKIASSNAEHVGHQGNIAQYKRTGETFFGKFIFLKHFENYGKEFLKLIIPWPKKVNFPKYIPKNAKVTFEEFGKFRFSD